MINDKRIIDEDLSGIVQALDQIANAVHANAVEHQFHDFDEDNAHFMDRELLNLVGEVSELREAARDGKLYHLCDKANKMAEQGLTPLTCLEEEYADIVIRALDQLTRLNGGKRSVGEVILTKHLYNRTRPVKHGRVTA